MLVHGCDEWCSTVASEHDAVDSSCCCDNQGDTTCDKLISGCFCDNTGAVTVGAASCSCCDNPWGSMVEAGGVCSCNPNANKSSTLRLNVDVDSAA